MKFLLLYEGQIAPRQRANLEDIHAIRMALDPQIRALWEFSPLNVEAERLLRHEKGPDEIGLVESRGTNAFIPIVSKKIDLQCNLEITFLQRQAPGQLIGDGGDIDNRIKTLLDALAVPPFSQQEAFRLARLPAGQAVFLLVTGRFASHQVGC
jgi:hypothetical protein